MVGGRWSTSMRVIGCCSNSMGVVHESMIVDSSVTKFLSTSIGCCGCSAHSSRAKSEMSLGKTSLSADLDDSGFDSGSVSGHVSSSHGTNMSSSHGAHTEHEDKSRGDEDKNTVGEALGGGGVS